MLASTPYIWVTPLIEDRGYLAMVIFIVILLIYATAHVLIVGFGDPDDINITAAPLLMLFTTLAVQGLVNHVAVKEWQLLHMTPKRV